MRIHPKRPSPALVIALLAVFTTAVGVLAACGGNEATDSTTTSSAAAPPTTTTMAQQRFVSDLYSYSIDSTDWTGTSAQTAWDGTGSPGDGDSTVDSLSGPELQRAFAYAGPTKATLKEFVAKGRRTNAQLRDCPAKPEKTESTTIDGEPAIIDELHCGVFALSASTIHDGQVYVFFTYDQPGKEAEMRDWFRSLVKAVSFSA
jgi:hypothetical protein